MTLKVMRAPVLRQHSQKIRYTYLVSLSWMHSWGACFSQNVLCSTIWISCLEMPCFLHSYAQLVSIRHYTSFTLSLVVYLSLKIPRWVAESWSLSVSFKNGIISAKTEILVSSCQFSNLNNLNVPKSIFCLLFSCRYILIKHWIKQ